MEFKESITHQIECFNVLISEINDHIDDASFFRELSKRAKYIANDIDKIHSGYYFAFVDNGPDDNFIRIYYPLGFVTAKEAWRILKEELIDENFQAWNECGIGEVTKQEFDKFNDLLRIQNFYDDLYDKRNSLDDILPSNFLNNLKTKILKLRCELGFNYRWIRVCSRY